jgi:hypothetical protein
VSWQTVAFTDFGGLDLTSSPDNSACIDMLNVDLDKRGALRTRAGFVDFTSSAAADAYLNVHVRLDGDVLASRQGDVSVISPDGSVSGTDTTTTSPVLSYADVGTPSLSNTCYATANERVKRWTGAIFEAPVGNPGARYLAVQPNDNRLVAAGVHTLPTGSTASASVQSLVHFSAAGDPDTWGADDWVLLTPGDGGTITGAAAWRELTFIFKQRKFFVFYGNSVDSTGGSIFNYRAVDAGVGAISVTGSTSGVAVAPDAVYFIGNDGRIYRTTGGAPVAISRPIEAAVFDTQSAFSQVDSVDIVSEAFSFQGLAYADGRLFVTYNADTASPNSRQLVYDIAGDYWLYWNLPAYAFGANTVNTPQRYPIYFANTGANILSRVDREATTDDGTAIVSRYRTGFYDLGVQGEKRTRETTAWGTGTLNLKLSRDFGSLDTARELVLGTSPAIDRDTATTGKDGFVISHEFSASSGAWRVDRTLLEMMPKRAAGSKTP